MTTFTQWAIELTEKGWIPDPIIRWGIRRLVNERMQSLGPDEPLEIANRSKTFLDALETAPIAHLPDKANEQHYEIPPAFFKASLGKHLKYSACLWQNETTSLNEAEDLALDETAAHAQLQDGQEVLELGCGWGSFTLWMASHYPNSRITGVSNSKPQRDYILNEAKLRNLTNVEIITTDMNTFSTAKQFDRVVSVEMFEHMRNWPKLFNQVSTWLKPQGLFFMHVFCHRHTAYFFEVQDDSDWMSQYFFSGGMMPSYALPKEIPSDLDCIHDWSWNGSNYAKTANAWLENMDQHKSSLWPVFEATYGADRAETWWQRWRIFYMACAELFDYKNGHEWLVGHYLFRKVHVDA